MPKYYCSSCGGATDYSFDLPKFCASCGAPRNSNVANKPQPTNAKPNISPIQKQRVRVLVEEEEPEEDIPQIDGLEFDLIEARRNIVSEKFGEVAKQQKTGISRPKEKFTAKKIKQEFLHGRQERANPINIGSDDE